MASKHFAAVAADPTADERQLKMNGALLASAEGEWGKATEVLREIIAKDNEDYVVRIPCWFWGFESFQALMDDDWIVVTVIRL